MFLAIPTEASAHICALIVLVNVLCVWLSCYCMHACPKGRILNSLSQIIIMVKAYTAFKTKQTVQVFINFG